MDSSSYQQIPQEGNLGHQSQQPQQQQQSNQSHDPSQIQAYNPSYQDYNAYYSQHGQYNQYSSQYYPQDYANYNAQAPQPQFQGEPTSVHPPGVPVQTEPYLPVSSEQTQLQNWQNVYYSHGNVENLGHLNQNSALGNAAALSHLSQFNGSIDAAQRVMQPQIGPSPYRGGFRRGSRPFKRGGRAPFGRHVGRPDGGSASPFRGRAGGQGGGRHLSRHDAPPLLVDNGAVLLPSRAAQMPAAPLCPPSRLSWCELCRVDCNTPENLEQHKNGKRHKKSSKTREELQRLNKVISEVQSDVIQSDNPTSENRNEQPTMESETKPGSRGPGIKRKMKGSHGSKCMKTNEGSKRKYEPFYCDLCNVKCESQVVFDSHLVGKKHLGNLKRFNGHRAIYGEDGLKELYPPNFNSGSTSIVPPQVQQTGSGNDPQALLAQLLMTLISQVQAPALQPLTGSAPAMEALAAAISGLVPATVAPATKSSVEAQNGQDLVTAEVKSELEPAKTATEAAQISSSKAETETEKGSLEDGVKVDNQV